MSLGSMGVQSEAMPELAQAAQMMVKCRRETDGFCTKDILCVMILYSFVYVAGGGLRRSCNSPGELPYQTGEFHLFG